LIHPIIVVIVVIIVMHLFFMMQKAHKHMNACINIKRKKNHK